VKVILFQGRIRSFKIFLLFAFITIASNGIAQKPEGEIRYLVTYNWVKMMKAVDYMSKEQVEKISYVWGNRSEWKMYCNLFFSDSLSRFEDSEEKAERDDEGFNWRKEVYNISRDLKRKRMKDYIEMLGKVYIIEDTLITPDWKILNDIKDVSGHICMNAFWNDTLQKKKIIAWFALDIPVSAGPERLGGLPGMILEADINNGAKVLTADMIELKTLTTELNLPKKMKGKKITEDQYNALLKKIYDERRKAEQPPFWGIRY
jgi:GLPGLI family protein